MSATPSAVLSKILPTKPSQTTTSTVPLKISLPSTFPAKFGIFANSLYASLVTSLPLLSSSPLLGVKAPVIIAHGKSNPKAIQNAIFQAINAASSNLDSIIEQRLVKYSTEQEIN